jgi:hypothetical protein
VAFSYFGDICWFMGIYTDDGHAKVLHIVSGGGDMGFFKMEDAGGRILTTFLHRGSRLPW